MEVGRLLASGTGYGGNSQIDRILSVLDVSKIGGLPSYSFQRRSDQTYFSDSVADSVQDKGESRPLVPRLQSVVVVSCLRAPKRSRE